MNTHREPILCVEASSMRAIASQNRLQICRDFEWLDATPVWFVPRYLAEKERRFRQIIPYVVLISDDGVVAYRRTSRGSEPRLHERLSIGFGGHVELADLVLADEAVSVRDTVQRAASREVSEELDHSAVIEREWVGAIVSDHDCVSRVHLGIVQLWRLRGGAGASREAAIAECEVVPLIDLPKLRGNMERWSQLVSDWLVRSLGESSAEVVPLNSAR